MAIQEAQKQAVTGERSRPDEPHVVIIGGGFGGLQAAKKLGKKPVKVTIIDQNNFHLFQPYLTHQRGARNFPRWLWTYHGCIVEEQSVSSQRENVTYAY